MKLQNSPRVVLRLAIIGLAAAVCGCATGRPAPQSNGAPDQVTVPLHVEKNRHGVAYGFLLDTGASFTMVSEEWLGSLGTKHPDWPRHPGAFGDAATLGGQTLETMFIPGARWGSFTLDELGVTSQRKGTFETFMSSMMAAPIIGSLAGNVLKEFRVELDYASQTLYLSTP